jgi:acetyltransferase-like isoleucine patch superfamily enzyme
MIKRFSNRLAYWIVYRLLRKPMTELVTWVGLHQPKVFGEIDRLHISEEAIVQNATFNLASGHITIERTAFFGHNVTLLTGTHDYKLQGEDRMRTFPEKGRDIVVKEGAWLASNVTVLGPCVIGRHAVVGACSLVMENVADYSVVAGVPARVIRSLQPPSAI